MVKIGRPILNKHMVSFDFKNHAISIMTNKKYSDHGKSIKGKKGPTKYSEGDMAAGVILSLLFGTLITLCCVGFYQHKNEIRQSKRK
jgi:hypothetical protein